MLIQFHRPEGVLVGGHSYGPGEVAEVADAVAHRLIRAGAAGVPLDAPESAATPEGPPPVETAEAKPGKRRKVD